MYDIVTIFQYIKIKVIAKLEQVSLYLYLKGIK